MNLSESGNPIRHKRPEELSQARPVETLQLKKNEKTTEHHPPVKPVEFLTRAEAKKVQEKFEPLPPVLHKALEGAKTLRREFQSIDRLTRQPLKIIPNIPKAADSPEAPIIPARVLISPNKNAGAEARRPHPLPPDSEKIENKIVHFERPPIVPRMGGGPVERPLPPGPESHKPTGEVRSAQVTQDRRPTAPSRPTPPPALHLGEEGASKPVTLKVEPPVSQGLPVLFEKKSQVHEVVLSRESSPTGEVKVPRKTENINPPVSRHRIEMTDTRPSNVVEFKNPVQEKRQETTGVMTRHSALVSPSPLAQDQLPKTSKISPVLKNPSAIIVPPPKVLEPQPSIVINGTNQTSTTETVQSKIQTTRPIVVGGGLANPFLRNERLKSFLSFQENLKTRGIQNFVEESKQLVHFQGVHPLPQTAATQPPAVTPIIAPVSTKTLFPIETVARNPLHEDNGARTQSVNGPEKETVIPEKGRVPEVNHPPKLAPPPLANLVPLRRPLPTNVKSHLIPVSSVNLLDLVL